MKKLYLLITLLFFALQHTNAQLTTETFESFNAGVNTFTNGTKFNLTSTFTTFTVYQANGLGYNGSNKFIQVGDDNADGGRGQTGTIKAESGVFKVNNLWIFTTGNSGFNAGATFDGLPGSVTFTGKLAGITQFTLIKATSGTNIGEGLPNKGFFPVNFATDGGVDYTNILIDQLDVTLSYNYDYFAIDDFTFTKITSPLITLHPSNKTICNGGSTTFSAAASNATSYQWQVDTGSGFNNLSNGGVYTNVTSQTLTITGGMSGMNGFQFRCVATGSGSANSNAATLTVPTAISPSISAQTNNSAYGGNTGYASISVSGGTAPYSYSWSPSGGTGSSAFGLTAGTYTVTVTDNTQNGGSGCSATKQVIITEPPGFAVSTASLSGFSSCPGTASPSQSFTVKGGQLSSSLDLVAPTGYEISTSSGGIYTDNISYPSTGGTVTEKTVYVRIAATATGTPSGNLTISSTGITTKNIALSGTITAIPAITGQPAAVEICANENAAFSVFASNAVGYKWQVNQGGGFTDITNTAPYSGATTSTLTITGVTAAMNGFTYRALATGAAPCNSITYSDPVALTVNHIDAAVTQINIKCRDSRTGEATVTATGGTGTYTYSWAPSGGTGATATGLNEGTYTVTITDGNSCQTTKSVTITQPATTLTATPGTVNNVSCNGGANGSATVNVSGGTGGYSYSWAPSGGTNATATGLRAGIYTVTIFDANDCMTTQSFTISEPAALEASFGSQVNVSCNGGSNGTATVNVSGGAGNYTYQWSPTGGNAATASGLQAGTYTVTVTDANACGTTQSFEITQPAILSVATGGGKTDVSCNGGANGTATVAPTGGTSTYTYSWNTTPIQRAAKATGLKAGTYTVTVTDANSCQTSRSFSIGQPDELGATTSQINATCSTAGEASVTPFGGVGGYTYLWAPTGATTQTVTGLAAGNYSCEITDGNGCSIIKTVTINTTNTLVATTSQTDVLCNGANTGSATVVASGAPGPFTYTWAPRGGSSHTATNLTAGNYAVTITSSNGCSIIKNITIIEPSAITITPTSQINASCNGGSNGSVSVTGTGGTGVLTYSWNTNPVQTSATATGLKAGTYTLTVTDASSCTKTRDFTITEPDALIATTSQTDVSCNGGTNGSATVNVIGGTGAYSYQWAPSGGTNATASGLAAGTYTVAIKDSKLCETTASVTITEPALLTATIDKTDVLCYQANNGTATVTPSGGTFPYTYSWSLSGGTDATATGLSPNTYTVKVTDANGCSVTESVQIKEPSILSATNTHTDVSCNGGNNGTASVVVTGGTGTYTYSWAPYGGTDATAAGLSAGIYTVTVKDENSCSVTNTITITEPEKLEATTAIIDVSCHNGNNGSVSVTATGGTGAYTYLWSNSGETTSSVGDLTAGTYTVTITDQNSCSVTVSAVVKQPVNPISLNTAVVSGITVSGATLSGAASSDGINTDSGTCLTEVGFVYAQHSNPTVADSKINISSALGTYTNTLSGLRGNRTYYVRTYAVNSSGFINYGQEVNFTTEKYTLTITAGSGHTKVYGTADPVFNYTALGFTNGDTNAILNGLLSRDAGENVGKYNIKLGNISAGADYVIAFTGAEFEITKANQTITWNQTLEFGCADSNTVGLTATADSGLPVSYTIANTTLGTISGSTLNILGSGSTTISAAQSGDQNHNAATAVIKPIEISQSGIVIQQWADVLLFDNKSNNFVAWQWYKNGSAVSGATRQYYSENQPLNGTYYVIAKDKNGNSIKSCPIEASGAVFTKKLKIYPNPVKPGGEFTLECDFSESQLSGSEVVLYDITGKSIQTISNVKAKNQIIAPSQVALYIVVLKLADGQLKTINLLVK